MYMLYFNEEQSSVETEQISIILGKNFVISFQEDANRDVFNSLRDKIKLSGSKVRVQGADFLSIHLLIWSLIILYSNGKTWGKNRVIEEDILRNASQRSLVKINHPS